MDYEIILDTLTTSIKRYRDNIDKMLLEPRHRIQRTALENQRHAYVCMLNEISALKTEGIQKGFANCGNEIEKILGEK